MRVRKNGSCGYMVQWNIVPLRKNKEYALHVFVADMLKDNLDSKCLLDSPYRVRVEGENLTAFTRTWRANLVDHIWGEGTAPDTAQLRKQVIVEPMKDSRYPKTRDLCVLHRSDCENAYITASMSIDDDKIRKNREKALERDGRYSAACI